jgi:hypothetical protein
MKNKIKLKLKNRLKTGLKQVKKLISMRKAGKLLGRVLRALYSLYKAL